MKRLTALAWKDGALFDREMNARFESWVGEMRARAGRTTGEGDERVPAAYEVVRRAAAELAALETTIPHGRLRKLLAELEAEYVRVVGRALDRRLILRLQSARFR